jgi:hypothetical protein
MLLPQPPGASYPLPSADPRLSSARTRSGPSVARAYARRERASCAGASAALASTGMCHRRACVRARGRLRVHPRTHAWTSGAHIADAIGGGLVRRELRLRALNAHLRPPAGKAAKRRLCAQSERRRSTRAHPRVRPHARISRSSAPVQVRMPHRTCSLRPRAAVVLNYAYSQPLVPLPPAPRAEAKPSRR